MEMNVNSQNVMNRINIEKKDAMYLKHNEDRTYEFINSFDLIYSDISTGIRNSLHEKLNEIESSNDMQEKDIVSLMIIAYDFKKELDKLLSEANSMTNDNQSVSSSFHSSITNEDYAQMPNNTIKKINPVFNVINRLYSSTVKKSKDLVSIKPKALSIENEKENNTVYYSVNNNYYKTIFTRAYNTENKDKVSRPNSNIDKKNVQLDNTKTVDSLFNIIKTVKQSKSKNSFTCAKNNKNLFGNEIDKENLRFIYTAKRKPPSEGNFSNSNTSVNSKQTKTNSDKIENLFRMSNKNLETKNLKSEKLTVQLRSSLNTPQKSKDIKIRKEENKPMKIIKKLFCDKKSSNVFSQENEKNNMDMKILKNENILKMAKEFDLIEHIQIDLFSKAIPDFITRKPQDLFTNINNENIILKLFDYCNTKSEKIKIKNISKITRNKFFEYEANNLNHIIEIKKLEENPLNKLKITDKDIFSKKFILAELYSNQDELKNTQKQNVFRNLLLFINSILSLEKINLEAISSSIHNEDRVDDDVIQKMIKQIESILCNDRNIYSKYKEIIKNLKNKKELSSNFKEIKKITNGKFFLEIIEFLTNQESTQISSELDVLIELIEAVNNLLEEDQKINFELGIDIEILNHRKELILYYKENL